MPKRLEKFDPKFPVALNMDKLNETQNSWSIAFDERIPQETGVTVEWLMIIHSGHKMFLQTKPSLLTSNSLLGCINLDATAL